MLAASTQRAEPEAMLVDTDTTATSGESSESAVKSASADIRKILQVSLISFFTLKPRLSGTPERRVEGVDQWPQFQYTRQQTH